MKLIRGLNWALAVLGVIILIAFIVVILPWKNAGSRSASDADGRVPATVPDGPTAPIQTEPPLPETALLKDAAVGECVVFGHYEQDNDEANGKEEIKWLVLEKDGGRLKLLSLYALDCQPFHNKIRFIYWSNCMLRPWLNEVFLNSAFTEEEQKLIETTKVEPDPNPRFSALPGAEVEDKVFLLGFTELEQYFSSNDSLLCIPTAYAKAQGAYVRNGFVACWWWLRSPGNAGDHAGCIGNLGDSFYKGLVVTAGDVAVRPAIWVNTGG